jgi:hypothetical protein
MVYCLVAFVTVVSLHRCWNCAYTFTAPTTALFSFTRSYERSDKFFDHLFSLSIDGARLYEQLLLLAFGREFWSHSDLETWLWVSRAELNRCFSISRSWLPCFALLLFLSNMSSGSSSVSYVWWQFHTAAMYSSPVYVYPVWFFLITELCKFNHHISY